MALSVTSSNRRCVFSARSLAAAAGTVACMALAGPAGATGFSWANTAGGLWSNSLNWSPIGVPLAAGDTAAIGATGAAYTVTMDVTPTLDGLTVSSNDATLFVSGRTVTVSGATGLTAGVLQLRSSSWIGAGLMSNGATVFVEGSSTIANLSNAGLLTVRGVSGLNSALTVSSPFSNTGTLVLTSQVNASANLTVGGSGVLTNGAAGEFRIEAGAGGPRAVDASVQNAGAVNVNGDATYAKASGLHTNTGAYTILTGRTLTINGNSQRFEQNGGTLVVDGELAVNSATFRLQGGAISGNGLVRLTNSRLEMGGGGSGTVVTRGTGTMGGSIVSGQTVLVRGEPGINTNVTTDGGFSNMGTLTFTSLANASANMTVGGSGTLSNFGALNILGGAGGTRQYDWNLSNQAAGTVEIDGDAVFSGPSRTHTTAGQFHVATGRSLTINGNSQRFEQNGGTLVVDGELAVNSATFRLQGGAISGGGLVRLTNSRLEMGGGGSGTVVTRGTGTMGGSIVSGQTVLVRGETGINTSVTTDGGFSNVGTLTFTSLVNAAANMTVGGSGTLSNFGALNILGGAGGTRQYDWNLSNQAAGTVEIDADAVFSGPSRTHTTAGQFHIATARSLTISGNSQTFTLTNGTLDVDGLLDVVSATFVFNGGTLTGDGTTRVTNGRLSLGASGSGTVVHRGAGTMVGNIKTNQSVLVRGESALNTTITADDSFSNAGHLTFGSTVNANSNMTVNKGGTLTNNGTLEVLPGAGGGRQYDWNLVNSAGGTVDIDADTVFVGSGRSHANSGQFMVRGGDSLTVSGSGQTFTQQAGTLQADGLLDVSSATLALNGGAITGAGTVRTTNGRLTFGPGPGAVSGTVIQRGTGTMAGDVPSGAHVITRGESALNTAVTADDSFMNLGSLTFTSTVFANSNMTVGGAGTLTNKGVLSVLPGAGGQRQYDWNLTNDATGSAVFNADTTFVGGGRSHSSAGAFSVATGRSLTVSGGAQSFALNGGTFVVDGVFDASSSTFAFNGGAISGDGTVRVTNGRLTHGAGGTGTVVHRGTGTMGGDVPSGHRVVVRGESALNTTITADGSFVNAGTIDLTSTVFANGILTVAGGQTLTNTGNFNILSGAGGARQLNGVLVNQGVFSSSAVASVGAVGANHTSSAVFAVESGTLTITGNSFTNLAGGSVRGNGTLNVSAFAVTGLQNDGSVDPGLSIGSLTIQGRLTNGAAGQLGIEIAGVGAGQFDVLNVTGQASLNGRVAVALMAGYTPALGDSFRVLNYASRVGVFGQVVTIAGNLGVSFEAQYSGAFMTLVVTAIPAPGGAGTLLLLGLGAVRRRR